MLVRFPKPTHHCEICREPYDPKNSKGGGLRGVCQACNEQIDESPAIGKRHEERLAVRGRLMVETKGFDLFRAMERKERREKKQ